MSKFKYTYQNLVFVAFLVSPACGKKGDSWDFAINPGNYNLSGPTCVSTGAAPVYKNVAQRINFFDFDDVQTHALKIDGSTSTRTIVDADCKMTVIQPIHDNRDGTFALRVARHYTFEPEGCALSVSAAGKTFDATTNSSDGMKDNDNTALDIPFEVHKTEVGIELISANIDDLNALWGEYGCSTPDRLKWNVTIQN